MYCYRAPRYYHGTRGGAVPAVGVACTISMSLAYMGKNVPASTANCGKKFRGFTGSRPPNQLDQLTARTPVTVRGRGYRLIKT